jgi:hypothetical protein
MLSRILNPRHVLTEWHFMFKQPQAFGQCLSEILILDDLHPWHHIESFNVAVRHDTDLILRKQRYALALQVFVTFALIDLFVGSHMLVIIQHDGHLRRIQSLVNAFVDGLFHRAHRGVQLGIVEHLLKSFHLLLFFVVVVVLVHFNDLSGSVFLVGAMASVAAFSNLFFLFSFLAGFSRGENIVVHRGA